MRKENRKEKKKKTRGAKFINEFKEFAFRGNMIDLAVGIVIGAAFNAIVNSLVNNIVMPIVGVITAGQNFMELKFQVLNVDFRYGEFIQAIVNFAVIAFSLFLVIKVINRIRSKPQEDKPTEVELLKEIRDLLSEKA